MNIYIVQKEVQKYIHDHLLFSSLVESYKKIEWIT